LAELTGVGGDALRTLVGLNGLETDAKPSAEADGGESSSAYQAPDRLRMKVPQPTEGCNINVFG
jgi:hypothetical protein